MSQRKISVRARKVWQRLAATYGMRLADSFGSEPPQDWCNVIDRTDNQSLEMAVVNVRQQHPNHPPTLGEFMGAIPRKVNHERNVVDELAVTAVARFRLCRHQLARPWHYFGSTEERLSSRGGLERVPVVAGVVIPSCDCDEGGNAGYRLKVEEIGRR